MNDDVRRVGVLFRARRKDRNLGLKEVENGTSIRTNYLEAIEEGTIYQHVSGVYAVGFMKQYANFLGLDFEGMARETPQAFKIQPEKHDFDYGIGTLEMRGSAGGGVRWLPTLMWGLASTLVLTLAWMLAKYLKVL